MPDFVAFLIALSVACGCLFLIAFGTAFGCLLRLRNPALVHALGRICQAAAHSPRRTVYRISIRFELRRLPRSALACIETHSSRLNVTQDSMSNGSASTITQQVIATALAI